MEKEEDIKSLFETAKEIFDVELKRHNDASHPLNIMLFLVDNDLLSSTQKEYLNKKIIDSTFEGTFHLLENIPSAFGGPGGIVKTWIMCDLPIITYISIKLNGGTLLPVHKSILSLISSSMEQNGWRCTSCANLGRFRGPGRKDDECPIATLNVLKLLTLTKGNTYITGKQTGIDTLLKLWNDRKTRRPYLFGMGTDFQKVKYPLIWYDILNVLNVLSHYKHAVNKDEFREMNDVLNNKIKLNGYKPESVYLFWKKYDFGQKRVESKYIKNTIEGIEKRIKRLADWQAGVSKQE